MYSVTDSMAIMIGSFTVSIFWVIICDYFTDFENLEAVFGCPTVTDFMSSLFGFSAVLDTFRFFLSLFFENRSHVLRLY